MIGDVVTGDFGAKLRAMREQRGITLREIATSTKISVGVLEALERNDISRMPGGIFTRGFVRSYAAAVGFEPEQAVREFMAQFPHESVTAGHPTSTRFDDDSSESNDRTAAILVKIVAVSVPVTALIVYFVASPLFHPAAPSAEPSAALAAAPAAERRAAAAPLTPAAPEPAPETPPIARDTFTVGVSARAPCWVSIVVDGVPSLQRLMSPGEQHSFEVRGEIVLRAGNAGALALTFNGSDGKPIGRPGEVVTRHVTAANFKDYLAAP